MEKNKVEIDKIRDRILDVNVSISGTSSTSGLSGTSGYSGRSGYGHIRGDATSGEWVDTTWLSEPNLSRQWRESLDGTTHIREYETVLHNENDPVE